MAWAKSAGVSMKARGLSLIEVLILIAVLAVLAGLAAPRFAHYEQQRERDKALESLYSIAECQRRLYTMTRRYDSAYCLDGHRMSGGGYEVSIDIPQSGRSFLLTAIPRDAHEKGRCSMITLDHNGRLDDGFKSHCGDELFPTQG